MLRNLAIVVAIVGWVQTGLADVKFVAYQGVPFGVGTLTISDSEELLNPRNNSGVDVPEVSLLQLGDQAFYPVVEHRIPRPNDERPLVVHFLFKPADSISVTFGHSAQELTTSVQADANAYQEQLEQWWQAWTGYVSRSARTDRYPPELDQYLATMLAQRLGKAVPKIEPAPGIYSSADETARIMAFMTGTESIRLAMQKEELLKPAGGDTSVMQPLPVATSPPAALIPDVDDHVPVEPIVLAVPPECFYLRFGSYDNFSWFRKRVNEWGTDVRDLLSARSIDYHVSDRLQTQLQLHDTELTELLGPAVISDVALIGNDPFVREGAGLGILFQAANNALLSANVQLQRAKCAAADNDVTLAPVTFPDCSTAGTFLSSPDNRVRSFYVVYGNYHLITTSRHLAKRFLDVTEGRQESLGATNEFRYSRSVTPLSRDDSAFLYLSDPFFRSFVDPGFRVEMTRRARSDNQIQLVQFAVLAAKSEGMAVDSIEALIEGRFLPEGFAARADGSALEIRYGQVIDTVRGARGTFVPIADLPVTEITEAEARAYERFSAAYRRLWTKMDPATVAVSRKKEGDFERLTMDLHVYPFPVREYGLLLMFAQKRSAQRLVHPENVLMMAEAHVFGAPLFAGLVDADIPFTVKDGEVDLPVDRNDNHPWFIGSRKAGVLEGFMGKTPVADGEFTTNDDQWVGTTVGLRKGDFTLYAKRRDVINSVMNQLKVVDAVREAQYRVHFGDLAKSKGVAVTHAFAWSRALRMSTGNALLLNRLNSQLHVSDNDMLSTAETLFQGTLLCPFGGTFERIAGPADSLRSGAWSSTRSVEWTDYRLPMLDRLHAADFELTAEGTTLTTHVELLLDDAD
ncbi:MAG: hypothetical protein R3C59_04930 [Planctomycetaceae bacterium]